MRRILQIWGVLGLTPENRSVVEGQLPAVSVLLRLRVKNEAVFSHGNAQWSPLKLQQSQ